MTPDTRPPQPSDAGLAEPPASWLVVERLPAYAPELNPVEGLWSSLKGVAYRNPDPLVAQADLEALARELDRSHPGAAGSLREGWPRPSRSAGWACHQRWLGPCAARTPSSR